VIDTWGSGLLRTNWFVWSADGIDLLIHTNAAGVLAARYGYNESHQPLALTNAVDDVTTFTYDGSNRLTSASLPTGLFTANVYDSNGRLASVTDNDGEGGSPFRTNSYTWTNGLVLAHTDPRGAATTNTCDALGRLIQVSDALGAVTNTYDKLDLIKTVDRMGFTRTNLYNAFRQLVRSVDARDHTIIYDYCNCGLLDSMTDRAGNTTSYTYDNAGRRVKTTFAGGSWVTIKGSVPAIVGLFVDSIGLPG